MLWLALTGQLGMAGLLYRRWLQRYPRCSPNLVAPAPLERLCRARAKQTAGFLGAWLIVDIMLAQHWRTGSPSWLWLAALFAAGTLAATAALRSGAGAMRLRRFLERGARTRAVIGSDALPPASTRLVRNDRAAIDAGAQALPHRLADDVTGAEASPAECDSDVVDAIVIAPQPAPLVLRPLREASRPIIGQDAALRLIEQDLRLACSGLTRRADRPLAAFLLAGPTGVGKTETAHAVAEVLYGSRERVARFSMNEVQGEGGNWRAFGSPPGYRDSERGGLLTNRIKGFGHRCVILIDELEKGPAEVFDGLLTGLDTGDFVEALTGRKVPIRECVLILTTNAVGQAHEQHLRECSEEELRRLLLDYRRAGSHVFNPEFLGRIKRVLWYRPLLDRELAAICRERYRLLYAPNVARVLGRQVPALSEKLAAFLAAQLGASHGGVRSLDRLIEDTILRVAAGMHCEDAGIDGSYRWDLIQEAGGVGARIQLVRAA